MPMDGKSLAAKGLAVGAHVCWSRCSQGCDCPLNLQSGGGASITRGVVKELEASWLLLKGGYVGFCFGGSCVLKASVGVPGASPTEAEVWLCGLLKAAIGVGVGLWWGW